MKLRVKIILCCLLMAFAAASLLAVLAELGVLDRAEPAGTLAQGYCLRTWEGRVAVFCPPDADRPEAVTDVAAQDLPPTDRLALIRGIQVGDREEVVRLLEDLGA